MDTHFTDGYLCDLCEDTYEDRQYSNVLACASSQVSEFVHWIQEQDFYENTTIVLVGDHLCMDETYFTDMVDNYDRKIIATWINSPVSRKEIGTRQYSQLDMFPTTLATLGCQIEGNRLGLGVNLYSEEPTLIEELGTEILSVELSRRSKYYSRKLMYNLR